MKKNKIWTRVLALCLAAVCLISAVGAANLVWDRNGDGKTDVWDLQMLVNQNAPEEDKAAALTEALGGKADELHPNANDVYEIYSVLGLYNMAKHATEGKSFKLMADIDMKGIDWTPIDNFRGTLDGNGKTISNVKITKCGVDKSMGFFSVVDYDDNKVQSVVKNLHLQDVEITATENVQFIGLLAGSNRGKIQDCTTVGVVNDARTTLPTAVYVGTIVGRNNNSSPDGTVSGGNTLDALEYYDYGVQEGTSKTTKWEGAAKVNSMMAMNFATLSYPEGTDAKEQYTRHIGIAGNTKDANIDTTLVWQDITNSSKFDSQILRDRRTKVAAAMYEMSTMYWTPSQSWDYYADGVKSNKNGGHGDYGRVAGNVYRGLPYNHGGSSIYRFLGYTELQSDGLYHTTAEVPTVGYYITNSAYYGNVNTAYAEYILEDTTQERKAELAATYPELLYLTAKIAGTTHLGFPQYIGADCSSQALMAWRAVNATYGTGKVTATHTAMMYACESYIKTYGIVPVNNFILPVPGDENEDGSENAHGDKSLVVNAYTRENKDHYMESLACVTKGDLLMDYTDEGGHTLLAMSDAVVIRTYKGVMDLDKSYIVTAEQGGSGGTRSGTIKVNGVNKTWSATCCVDEVNSFNTLYDVDNTDGYSSTFFPITCAALQQEDTPAATVTISMKDGVVNSNFQIIASSVNDGELVYAQIQQVNHRTAYNKLTVSSVHPNVATGDTVKVLLSNGQTYTFTY